VFGRTTVPESDADAEWLRRDFWSGRRCAQGKHAESLKASRLQDAPQRAQHRAALFVVHAGAHLRRDLPSLRMRARRFDLVFKENLLSF